MLTDQTARDAIGNIVPTAVVADRVLSCVAVQMLAGNPVVDAEDADLEQAEEAFGRVGVNPQLAFGAGVLASRMRDRVMPTHLAGEPRIGCPFVGAEHGVAVEPLEHQRIERHRAGGSDNRRPRLATAFDRSENHRLVIAASARRERWSVLLTVAGLAADRRFVGFDDARKRQGFAAAKRGAEPVQQMPAGAILNLHLPRQAHGADRLAVLSIRYIARYQMLSGRCARQASAVPWVFMHANDHVACLKAIGPGRNEFIMVGEALRDAEPVLDLAHGGQSSIGAKMRSHQSPVSRVRAALKAKNSAASEQNWWCRFELDSAEWIDFRGVSGRSSPVNARYGTLAKAGLETTRRLLGRLDRSLIPEEEISDEGGPADIAPPDPRAIQFLREVERNLATVVSATDGAPKVQVVLHYLREWRWPEDNARSSSVNIAQRQNGFSKRWP
jgi:hypothetical protein